VLFIQCCVDVSSDQFNLIIVILCKFCNMKEERRRKIHSLVSGCCHLCNVMFCALCLCLGCKDSSKHLHNNSICKSMGALVTVMSLFIPHFSRTRFRTAQHCCRRFIFQATPGWHSSSNWFWNGNEQLFLMPRNYRFSSIDLWEQSLQNDIVVVVVAVARP